MSPLFTKEKRIIYLRKITGFWEEFKRKRIGLFGLGMLLVFVGMAIFAPWLTPYDPLAGERLAQDFAMPEWVTIFPQYKDYPTTKNNLLYWDIKQGREFVTKWGTSVVVQYVGDQSETVHVEVSGKFPYEEAIPPNNFYCQFVWGAPDVQDTEFAVSMTLFTPNGTEYLLWFYPPWNTTIRIEVSVESVDPDFRNRLGYPEQKNPAPIIFSEKGEYTVVFTMRFKPESSNANCQVKIEYANFITLGHVHGILGCDDVGADIFSQLIYSARISLVIGLLAAFLGASIGIIVGVITGYVGGVVDEVMMRIVDILLCLPFLPLLLTLVFLFGKSIFYIVLFIAIFGWQGLARVIRSNVLALREAAFIECARASGASRFYIMVKHLVPNVLPIAFASLVLRVPAAILFEASLSFLGFGDPRVPTWGKMLHHAFGFGAFTRLAWWWILPPGLAITGLCLSFVFMGHALDEVVNPRLRRRR